MLGVCTQCPSPMVAASSPAAVARLAPRASGGAGVDSLRPSLLPDEHRGERVVLRLLDLLNEPEAAR